MRIVPEVYLSVKEIIGKKEKEKVGSNEVQLYYSVKQKRKKIAGLRWKGYCQKTGRGWKRADEPASSLKEKKKKRIGKYRAQSVGKRVTMFRELDCIGTNRSMAFLSSNRAYVI
jgi:hypothetical protein